jgi:hypothetical protein
VRKHYAHPMETWGIIIAAVSVVAVSQARAARVDRKDAEDARNESRSARDEAVRLSAEANEAFVRQAEAQERANEIEMAKIEKPDVGWEVQGGIGTTTRQLINTGNIDARDVVATGSNGVITGRWSSSKLVEPGDSIEYSHEPTYDDVGRPTLRVEWADDTQDERRAREWAVQ